MPENADAWSKLKLRLKSEGAGGLKAGPIPAPPKQTKPPPPELSLDSPWLRARELLPDIRKLRATVQPTLDPATIQPAQLRAVSFSVRDHDETIKLLPSHRGDTEKEDPSQPGSPTEQKSREGEIESHRQVRNRPSCCILPSGNRCFRLDSSFYAFLVQCVF